MDDLVQREHPQNSGAIGGGGPFLSRKTAVSLQRRGKIRPKLLWRTNRKSHTCFRLVQKSMTSDDLERIVSICTCLGSPLQNTHTMLKSCGSVNTGVEVEFDKNSPLTCGHRRQKDDVDTLSPSTNPTTIFRRQHGRAITLAVNNGDGSNWEWSLWYTCLRKIICDLTVSF